MLIIGKSQTIAVAVAYPCHLPPFNTVTGTVAHQKVAGGVEMQHRPIGDIRDLIVGDECHRRSIGSTENISSRNHGLTQARGAVNGLPVEDLITQLVFRAIWRNEGEASQRIGWWIEPPWIRRWTSLRLIIHLAPYQNTG